MPRRRMPQAVFLTRQGDYAEAERIERELHGVLARLTRVLRLHAERWPAASPACEPSVTGRYASHKDFQPYNRARARKQTHNHAQSRTHSLTHSLTHTFPTHLRTCRLLLLRRTRLVSLRLHRSNALGCLA
jgi:hypothetical protein